ncbi:MAG: sugar ABC transporter permease [Firmicutes bacterium]|nr:sugar ABC transporter permease [Bacillota bacterium]
MQPSKEMPIIRKIAFYLSFIFFGLGNIAFGQIIKGLIFFALQIAIVIFFVFWGGQHLANFATIGTQNQEFIEIGGSVVTIPGDNSVQLFLLGVFTILLFPAVALLAFVSIKSGLVAKQNYLKEKCSLDFKTDCKKLIDKDLHKTLLTVPFLGLLFFTIVPLVFMILIAFTNFDRFHQHPELFDWVGFSNFRAFFNMSADGAQIGRTFVRVLGWTLIWAVLATVTCYFGGIFLAMLINQKGIRGKTFFRTVFVITIAIPAFITLSAVSGMMARNGIVNILLMRWGFISSPLPFFSDSMWARVSVIVINMWIGIPFTMLFATGVLQNIPSELHESAKIDGANAWVRFRKIVMPYVLFITAPVLITQFIGNINNFNVIFFLTGGAPAVSGAFGGAGSTDLLITWLFRLTAEHNDFSFASVIGLSVFLINILISLALFKTKSFKDDTAFRV